MFFRSAGLTFKVGGSSRSVSAISDKIFTNHPLDILFTGVLGLYTGHEVDKLELYTDQQDPKHCQPYTVTTDEWNSLITNLMLYGPKLQVDGSICFVHLNNTNFDGLLEAIGKMTWQLVVYMPGRYVEIDKGEVTGGALLSLMDKLSQDWEKKEGANNKIELYHKEESGSRRLALQLCLSTIVCRSEEEKDQVEIATGHTGLLYRPAWLIV